MHRRVFKVGEWEVQPLEGRIRRGEETVRLRPKAMDILCLLAATPGEAVERNTILTEVWGRTAVTDEPLTATIGELRRSLGDRRGQTAYIETIPKRGYRLIAPVELIDAVDSATVGDGQLGAPSPATGTAHDNRRRWPAILLVSAVVIAIGVYLLSGQNSPAPMVGPPTPESIAILPFSIPGAAEADLYFGDGLALEILTTLARIDGLRVAASNSSFEFRNRRGALDEIRASLDVDTVLNGTILRDGERLRIQMQLVDTRSGYNLWADTFDREMSDIFELQSDIAMAIADQLSLRFLEPGRLAGGRADSEAYLEYLRGSYLYETARDEAGLRQAGVHLDAAIASSPDFALARALLAGVWARLGDYGFELPEVAYENGREQALQALEINGDLARAQLMLGWIRMYYDWDWAGARESLGIALDLAPGDAFVISANAALNFHLGNFDQAVSLAEMAVARDPLRAAAHNNLAYFRYTAGDADGAEAPLARAEELTPGFPGSGMLHVQIDLSRGDVTAAAARKETHPLLSLLADVLVQFELGDEQAARLALKKLESEYAGTGPYQIAEARAWIGDRDQAFRWLAVARESRDPGMADLKVDRLLESIKQDPRYVELLEAMHFD